MTHVARRACSLVAVVIMVSVASSGAAQDPEAARAQMLDKDAGARFDQGDYVGALDRWSSAYETYPNPTTAWNIARCHEELRQLYKARSAFELFAQFDELTPEQQSRVERKLQSLDELIAVFKEAKDAGMAALEAGDPQTALAKLRTASALSPSADVQLAIIKAHIATGDLPAAQAEFTEFVGRSDLEPVDRARATEVFVELQRELESRQPETLYVKEPPPPPGVSTLTWAFGATALASGGAALGFLLLRDKAVSDGEDAFATGGDVEAARNDYDTYRSLELVMFGVAGTATAATILSLFADFSGPEGTGEADSSAVDGDTTLSVFGAPGGAGVRWEGRF